MASKKQTKVAIVGYKELGRHPRSMRIAKLLENEGAEVTMIGSGQQDNEAKLSDGIELNIMRRPYNGARFIRLVSLPSSAILKLLRILRARLTSPN